MNIHVGIEIIYLIKAIFFGLAAMILIPKEHYRKYFIYGLLFGGVGDFLLILVFGVLLGGVHYLKMGVFNILNITSFWTPIAWAFVMMFFLYGLPTKKIFFYLYVLCFGIFGYCLGLVLQNFGLYRYEGIYQYLAPIILSCWFYIVAKFYMRLEKVELK